MGDFIRTGTEVRVGATAAPAVKNGQFVAYVSGTLVSGVMRATATPAWAWDTSLAQTQANFNRTFLGVAADSKVSGDVRDILVNREGIFQFPVATALQSGFNIGDQFAPAQDGANNALSATYVAPCASGIGVGALAAPAFQGDTVVTLSVAGTLSTPYRGQRSE